MLEAADNVPRSLTQVAGDQWTHMHVTRSDRKAVTHHADRDAPPRLSRIRKPNVR